MAFPGGIDWTSVEAAIHAWVVFCTGLPATSVVWAPQDKPLGSPRPAAPAVVLHWSSENDVGEFWVDTENDALTFDDKTVTAVSAVADTLTIAGHGLENADGPVRVASTGTLPGGLAADTDYWVIRVDANTIKLAATFVATGGEQPLGAANPKTPVDITSAGSGTITVSDTAETVSAGAEVTHLARGMVEAVCTMECHATSGVDLDAAVAILRRLRGRQTLPSAQEILSDANVGLTSVERARAVRGRLDALLFEPRALMDVRFLLASEDSETGAYIHRAEAEGEDDLDGLTLVLDRDD